MLGTQYLIEHCVSDYREQNREEMFKVYVTDCLAGMLRSRGAKVKRFYDIMHPAKEDNRSAAEIARDITAKAGLKVVG